LVNATPSGYVGTSELVWTLATLAPGAVWHGHVVVQPTGALGLATLAAASLEQSAIDVPIAPPGGAKYYFYAPLFLRN
jgi:hypothetical protein